MKKLLAMVLALVMTLSLAVSANAAFKDADKVNDNYAEAVAVLNGMGVFKGYEDGSFKPEGDITRAEVATIVYRIYTADVAKNDKSGLYASYNKFSDMAGASWAAGYIGYCANAELVKGYPDGTFKPSGKVTGYEVLAMILRAVGYDKNGEFSGADWALHVAQTAQQADMLKNVKGVDLNAAATRELVAELLFRGIQTPTVTYTPAFGYVTDKVINVASTTLGAKNFKLDKADTADKWGRPGTLWTYSTGDKKTTVLDTPVATYTKAVAECDVAHDAGLTADTDYTVYVNGYAMTNKYPVNLTDTATKIGAQGRLVEVYDDVIVMIDTFLAKVNSVSDAAYDAQGHLKKEASINLTVYDEKGNPTTSYILTNGETNYGYAKDEYVLLNAYTPKTTNTVVDSKKVEKIGSTNNGTYGEIVSKATSVDGAQSIIYWNAKQHNVAGTVYDDAVKFYLDQAGTSLGNYTWYFDQYGNLIGDVEIAAATSYGVINSIWWAGNAADGTGVAKANVTYMDGTTGQVDISKMTYNYKDTLTSAPDAAYAYEAKTGTPFHYTGTTTGKLMTVDTLAGKDYFFVDDTAITNEVNDTNDLINGHLFQFTTQSNGTVQAVEVSGNKNVGYEKFASTYSAVSKDTLYSVATNNSTLFLVRSENTDGSYKYESITGINNIGNYAADEVDYVDLNADGVADYVFVIGDSVAAKAEGLFYYAGNDKHSYDPTTGYWTIEGFMDGEKYSLKVKNPNFFNGVGGYDSAALAEVNALTGTDHALYYVKTDDGVYVANSMYAYTANESTTNFADPRTDVYNDRTDVKVRIDIAGDANNSLVPGLLRVSGNDYIINGNTKFVVDGVKAETQPTNINISDYNLVIVFNTANAETKGLALQVYAVSKVIVSESVYVTDVNATVSGTNGKHVSEATITLNPVYSASSTETATLKASSKEFYKRDADGKYTIKLESTDDFVTGGYYLCKLTVVLDNADSDANGVNCLMSAPLTKDVYFSVS